MRIRTLVLAGAAAAVAAYLLDPREGAIRRGRVRTAIERLIRSRTPRSEPAPDLPPNLAPTAPIPSEAPAERIEPPPRDAVLDLTREEPGPVELPSSNLDDAGIVQRVRHRLEERRDLHTDDLIVDVVNGVVYLSGDLRDPQTFGEVVDLARATPGVRRVQSLLHLPSSETIIRSDAGPPGRPDRP